MATGLNPDDAGIGKAAFKLNLNVLYRWCTAGFLGFVLVLGILEQMGLSRQWIGFTFLLATIGLSVSTSASS